MNTYSQVKKKVDGQKQHIKKMLMNKNNELKKKMLTNKNINVKKKY